MLENSREKRRARVNARQILVLKELADELLARARVDEVLGVPHLAERLDALLARQHGPAAAAAARRGLVLRAAPLLTQQLEALARVRQAVDSEDRVAELNALARDGAAQVAREPLVPTRERGETKNEMRNSRGLQSISLSPSKSQEAAAAAPPAADAHPMAVTTSSPRASG